MFVFLFTIWIIFNGRFTVEICLIGLSLCAILYFFACKFLDFSIKKDMIFSKEIPLVIAYIGLLIVEIVKSTIAVSKFIVGNRKPQSTIIKFHSGLKTETARALLANSITLTPGTITLDLTEDTFTIHCLDSSFGVDMENLSFIKRLEKMEEVAEK